MVVATFRPETADGVSDTASGFVLGVAPDHARATVYGAAGWTLTTIVCFGSESEARAYAATHESDLAPLAKEAPPREPSEIFRWLRVAWPVVIPATASVPAPGSLPVPAPTPAPGTTPAPAQ
jgi:hypothetical protein